MKALFEKIDPIFGSSFRITHHTEPAPDLKFPYWHFHPELEIVYVKGGYGRRHIGHHQSHFDNGDLIFIGSDLPHSSFTDQFTGNDSETIIQMRNNFLGDTFFSIPEMRDIQQLFERAKSGLAFYGASKYRIGHRIERLMERNTFERLVELLSILQEMAHCKEYNVLNADGVTLEVQRQDMKRANRIYDYVQQNFKHSISLDEIASIANMTVPAFCRYFKKLSGKTFTNFVNEFRIIYACKLLTDQKLNITDVCYQSGFNNFSHFSRTFKETTGKRPSDYRKELSIIVK